MEKRIYLNNLYDYYKELFTEKQQEYFEDYYYNNFSLSEIAENYNVSRNAVHNQIKIVEEKLEEFESVLKLYDKKDTIISLLKKENVRDEVIDKITDLI